MRCPPEERRPTICGRNGGWLLPAAIVLGCEVLEGPYGGRAERRMNISLRNGIVASFGSLRLCLRYLKEYRVEICRFLDRKGGLWIVTNAK